MQKEYAMTKDERYKEMERVLKVILIHATFQSGRDLDPVHVEKLCRKVLGKEAITK